MKKCRRCKVFRDESKFSKDKSRKDGLNIYCKKCKKNYYRNNREKVLEYSREYRKNHHEERREYRKNYYIKNFERDKEKNRQYHKNNPEIIRAQRHRRRLMGCIPLWNNPFPSEIKIHDHHLNRNPGLIIPLPKITHQSGGGKNHWDHCLKWIKKLYCIDIERLFKIKKPKKTIDDWL